jgi:hypothetical protein
MKIIRFFGFVIMASSCICCAAQTRWCSITGAVRPAEIIYPPIARAAHISGTIIGHLQFEPSGRILGIDIDSGPEMLRDTVKKTVANWTIYTNASGEQPCQNLLIVDFTIGQEFAPKNMKEPPGALRFWINAVVAVLNTTNSATLSKSN